VLRNTLAGSKTVVSTSRDDPVPLKKRRKKERIESDAIIVGITDIRVRSYHYQSMIRLAANVEMCEIHMC